VSRFGGRVALVTGSSRGYGRAIGRALAAGGATVILNSRSSSADGRALAREITDAGGEAIYVAADIGQESAIAALAEIVRREFGRIDVIVHNAAWGYERPVDATTLAEFQDTMQVNTYALIAMARHFRPLFSEGGKFLYVSSIGAELAMAGYGTIGAAKAASEAVIRSLALEWAPRVQANVIRPIFISSVSLRSFSWAEALRTLVETESPLGIPDIAQLVDVALWLCGPDSSYVTGQVISVDGGFSAVVRRPGLTLRDHRPVPQLASSTAMET
jgi:NAD(P)-dependent dehydrogenase (short-subunit alcohol dehydrogenase family)